MLYTLLDKASIYCLRNTAHIWLPIYKYYLANVEERLYQKTDYLQIDFFLLQTV